MGALDHRAARGPAPPIGARSTGDVYSLTHRRESCSERVEIQSLESQQDEENEPPNKIVIRHRRSNVAIAVAGIAHTLQRRSLDLRLRVFGANDPATIRYVEQLSETCARESRWEEAHALKVRMLEYGRERFGIKDRYTLHTMGWVGLCLLRQGRLLESAALLRQTVAFCEKYLDDRDSLPDLLRGWLAGSWIFLHRYEEAKVTQEERLEKSLLRFGRTDSHTSYYMRELGTTLAKLRRWNEAVKIQRDALYIGEKLPVYGPCHDSIIDAKDDLATTLTELGMHEGAKSLRDDILHWSRKMSQSAPLFFDNAMRVRAQWSREEGRYLEAARKEAEVLRIRKEVYGPEHKLTIGAMWDLAFTLSDLGRYVEAESMQLQVLEFDKQHQKGRANSALENLAWTWMFMGRYKEAEAAQVQVVVAKKNETPDEAHTAMLDLACTRYHLGRYQEAESILNEVIKMRREILGPNKPLTFTAMELHAKTIKELGRLEEAEAAEVEVLKHQRKILGDHHPQTLATMAGLAESWKRLGRADEAEALLLKVLENTKDALGEQHPEAIKAAYSLAELYLQQSRLQEADTILSSYADTATGFLSTPNTQAIDCLLILSCLRHAQGLHAEVADLLRRVIDCRTEVLGAGHVHTLEAIHIHSERQASLPCELPADPGLISQGQEDLDDELLTESEASDADHESREKSSADEEIINEGEEDEASAWLTDSTSTSSSTTSSPQTPPKVRRTPRQRPLAASGAQKALTRRTAGHKRMRTAWRKVTVKL